MGGAEVFTHEVAKRWVKGGHEVTLFTSEFSGCRREEVLDGVRVVRAGGRLGVYWNAERFYRRLFSREGFDVELLAVAGLKGLRIVEMPTQLKIDESFSLKELFKMFVDLLGIAYRLRVLHWYDHLLR